MKSFFFIRLKVNALGWSGWLIPNFFDDPGWDACHNRVRGNILCYDGAGSNYRSLTYADTIRDDRVCPKPDIIFDYDAFGGDTLFYERSIRIGKYMVYSNDLGHWRGVNPVADCYTTLAANDGVFANETIFPNVDAGMRQVPEIVDMQNGAMHD